MWSQVQATSAIQGRGCPLIRSKHAMCLTEDGHIYLYGGRSMANAPLRDLWRFDTQHNQWEEILVPRESRTTVQPLTTSISFHGHHHGQHQRQQGIMLTRSTTLDDSHRYVNSSETQKNEIFQNDDPPSALQEHTMISANQKLYLFGGQVGFATDETPLWIFDLKNSTWRKFRSRLSDITSRPIGRRDHSAVLYHNHLMAIYGGYQDLRGSLSELWIFDINNEEWHRQIDATHPPSRHGHSAVVYQNSMYIYGGMTDLQIRGDFWAWHFKTHKWNRIKNLKNPGQLCSHSAIVVNDSMFVYGGQRSKGKPVNELWQYRFDTETWVQITISGLIPGCRMQHVSVANPFINFFQPKIKSKKSKKIHKKSQESMHISRNNNNNNINNNNINNNNINNNIIINNNNNNEFSQNENLLSKPKIDCFSVKEETDKENKSEEIVVVVDDRQEQKQLCDINNQECFEQKSQAEVKLRQRPILQRQRPFSDVTTNTAIAEEIFQAWATNTLNHRSVEESMSYYSLCFPTPQKLASPPKVQLSDHAQINAQPVNIQESISSNYSQIELVKRRENTDNIRSRIRRANLELKELNCALRAQNNSNYKHPASWHPMNSSAYYSFSLDISPDYEKELNFRCSEESSPSSIGVSHKINSKITDNIDHLQDYLEPEEMLEIVQDNNENNQIQEKLNTPRIDKNRKQSVSHSSSGYQSLILIDSSDETTSGSPLSLTQEITDSEIISNLKETLSKTIPSTSNLLPVSSNRNSNLQQISINSATQTSTLHSPEAVRQSSTFHTATRHYSSWKRLSNWKPNIREVIKEVIVPQSPILSRRSKSIDSQTSNQSLTPSSNNRRPMFSKRRKQKRIETGRNERQKKSKLSRILLPVSWRSKSKRNHSWRLCMYVFGGKELDTNSANLHRQPITIWKFYI